MATNITDDLVAERTFALRGILGAIPEDVDLVHGAEGLKKLFEFRF